MFETFIYLFFFYSFRPVIHYSSKIMNFLDGISVSDDDNNAETIENTKQLEDLEPFSFNFRNRH